MFRGRNELVRGRYEVYDTAAEGVSIPTGLLYYSTSDLHDEDRVYKGLFRSALLRRTGKPWTKRTELTAVCPKFHMRFCKKKKSTIIRFIHHYVIMFQRTVVA